MVKIAQGGGGNAHDYFAVHSVYTTIDESIYTFR